MKIKRRHALLHPRFILAVALLVLFAIWHVVSLGIGEAPRRIPTTSGVAGVFQSEFLQGETDPLLADATSKLSLLDHALITLQHWALGFGIALVLGLGIGVLLGLSNYASRISLPAVNFLRSMPSAALYPALILLVGINLKSKVFVVTFGALWPILLSTEAGIRTLHKETFDALFFMPISRARKLLLHLRWAAPSIFVGIELAVGIAFLLTVTAEMLGSIGGGLGSYIALSLQRYGGVASDRAAAALLIVGVMSYGLISATALIGNLFTRPQSITSRRLSSEASQPTNSLPKPATSLTSATVPADSKVVFSGKPYMWPGQLIGNSPKHQIDLIAVDPTGSRSFHRIWILAQDLQPETHSSPEQIIDLLQNPESNAKSLSSHELFDPALASAIDYAGSQPLSQYWVLWQKGQCALALSQSTVATQPDPAAVPDPETDPALETS